MSNNEPSKLDRLEALAESILQGLREAKEGLQEAKEGLREAKEGLQEAKEGLQKAEEERQKAKEELQETRAIVNSNAKAIQALADAVASDRAAFKKEQEEWRQDRRRVFEWMSRLAAAQADFYEVQADYMTHMERIDDRLAEILARLTPKDKPEQA